QKPSAGGQPIDESKRQHNRLEGSGGRGVVEKPLTLRSRVEPVECAVRCRNEAEGKFVRRAVEVEDNLISSRGRSYPKEGATAYVERAAVARSPLKRCAVEVTVRSHPNQRAATSVGAIRLGTELVENLEAGPIRVHPIKDPAATVAVAAADPAEESIA